MIVLKTVDLEASADTGSGVVSEPNFNGSWISLNYIPISNKRQENRQREIYHMPTGSPRKGICWCLLEG